MLLISSLLPVQLAVGLSNSSAQSNNHIFKQFKPIQTNSEI
jgi:hypothetical protein